MKKLNKKGFTLIELLAVITIMGILMMVAIPAVSRTIENSRRDTFADIAHEYVNAVRNAMLSDNIECKASTEENAKWKPVSALPNGAYYFPICTDKDLETADTKHPDGSSPASGSKVVCGDDIEQATKDLMESGGTSPFGNAEIAGFVLFAKQVYQQKDNESADDESYKLTSTTNYLIRIADEGGHGLTKAWPESDVKRGRILLTGPTLHLVPESGDLPNKLEYNEETETVEDSGEKFDVSYPCRMA